MATIDVFTPIVDDPRLWGRIAAVNAASDVYAMGATPLFALAFAAWPRDQLPLSLLSEVLAGGQEAAQEAGWVVAGGHTIDGPEPLYGQAVVGEVALDELTTNAGGLAGDALVLTKPIGTGLVATAVKRRPATAVASGGELETLYRAAVTSMTTTNAAAAVTARKHGAHAATDITGFGLLGHLRQLAIASGLAAVVEADRVPMFAGVAGLVATGEVPGGTMRNLDTVRDALIVEGVEEDVLVVLADAQTSGGLLVALPPESAEDAVAELRASGHDAARIGALALDPTPGTITIR